MATIAHNLQAVKLRIDAALRLSGRGSGETALIAVSKTFSPATIRAAHAAGQLSFGENFAQEAADKQDELHELDLDWHYIGPIQSNKTRLIAERFNWAHSVDRLKVAERLNAQRPNGMPALKVLIQVNASEEASKAGVLACALLPLACAVAQLPRLELRGLMAIPAPAAGSEDPSAAFRQMARLRAMLATAGLSAHDLSMGMSDDFELAIAAGATMVRVGSAIFGARGGLTSNSD